MASGRFVAMTTMFWGCDGHTPVMTSSPDVATVEPNPNASSYSEDVALKYANLAVAAFCGFPHFPDFQALEAWHCGPACDAVPDMGAVRSVSDSSFDNAYAFVGRLGDECVVSFRGTDNSAGWLSDLESARSVVLNEYGIPCEWQGLSCRVGYGFINNYMRVRKYLLGNLTELGCEGRAVSVAGHSLGGAIAVLALFDLKSQGYSVSNSYTFGQPRVGNSAFVLALDTLLAGEAEIFRVTHYQDPVPHLPLMAMGFRHHPHEAYYKGNTTDGVRICNDSGEDLFCADKWSGIFGLPRMLAKCVVGQQIRSDCDHMTYMAGLLPYHMGVESCQDPGSLEPPSFV